MSSGYTSYTYAELKAEAKSRGLSAGGSGDRIRSRLTADDEAGSSDQGDTGADVTLDVAPPSDLKSQADSLENTVGDDSLWRYMEQDYLTLHADVSERFTTHGEALTCTNLRTLLAANDEGHI